MSVTVVSGIDTGLVHTGVVSMQFDDVRHQVKVSTLVINGVDPAAAAAFCTGDDYVFIEDYRQRSSFNTDVRMIKAVAEMKAATGGTTLNNMGVKKIVKRPLMELLHVWSFVTPTHHQDLRSAARIALLGMLKDDVLNALLTSIVRAHLAGKPWTIIV